MCLCVGSSQHVLGSHDLRCRLAPSFSLQWRLFADVVNNCGMAIELMSPLVPGAFLLMASLGSIARSITGLASGATNAALTQHFARGSNAADINAKDAVSGMD